MEEKKMEVKKDLLKKLKKLMRDDMGEPLKDKLEGMKKVTVASDSEEGLKEGLSMAEKIMEKHSMMKDMDDYEEDSEDADEMMKKYKKSM